MRQVTTKGIILSRTNYGEADRIITFLTPDQGKISGLVKGVRKSKSKLAGGIELFSVSDITFIPGRGEVATIISTRLDKHYGNIVGSLDRTNAGYELIKVLNKATEDNPEPAYFNLLKESFTALDGAADLELIRLRFNAQLLKLAGHLPNLQTDTEGYKLEAGKTYEFNLDQMSFQASQTAHNNFGADQIKFLRLIFSDNKLSALAKVQGAGALANQLQPLVRAMVRLHLEG